VAAAVGIGSTALYHYFDSKLHCLYVIMADALAIVRSDFDRYASAHERYLDALLALLRGAYDLSDSCRRPILAWPLGRFSGSTTASGIGIARATRSASRRSVSSSSAGNSRYSAFPLS
jgi:AcrR family transcriptional regulator